MTLRQRTVETTLEKGKRGRLWAYGYSDLARLLKTTEGTVRNWCHEGKRGRKLDPANLLEVARAIVRVQGMDGPVLP